MAKIELAKELANGKFLAAGVQNHFLEVYKIIHDEFLVKDQDVLVAAILHDTLEDTETTYDELKQQFSLTVANLVEEVSHPKNYNQEQRLEYYKKLKHISSGAKLIKLADFTSHLRRMILIYKEGRQAAYPKFVNNNKYVAQIRDFLGSCEESEAKNCVLELTNQLSAYLK